MPHPGPALLKDQSLSSLACALKGDGRRRRTGHYSDPGKHPARFQHVRSWAPERMHPLWTIGEPVSHLANLFRLCHGRIRTDVSRVRGDGAFPSSWRYSGFSPFGYASPCGSSPFPVTGKNVTAPPGRCQFLWLVRMTATTASFQLGSGAKTYTLPWAPGGTSMWRPSHRVVRKRYQRVPVRFQK